MEKKERLENAMNLIARENLLSAMCGHLLNLTWDDNEDTLLVNGTLLPWGDYEIIDLDEIPYEDDAIDSILIFGDGTMEFRMKRSCEAFNYAEFPFETIDKVINILHQKVKEKYNMKS
jgi:hypothetical protein